MKAIDYKKVDLTDEEFEYYQYLVKTYTTSKNSGEEYFKNLFEVDEDGFIGIIKPKQNMPFEILFFVQQVMLCQRLRIIDKLRKEVKNGKVS